MAALRKKLVIVGDGAGALDADGSLYGLVVTVSATRRLIYAVDVKDTFDVEGDGFFNYRQVSAFVSECFQVDEVCHIG